ncbi:MAG: flagellar basal-body rod protein FlgG [Clostridiales bacterium]|jgi:flagellar basal-body rod protein FlgG|nr:flagellar basal-body rod protein FlgG [Clostridiales bacterium]
MNISFYNGVSGMVAFQEKMNQVSHQIANVGTAGFKSSRTSFSELLSTRMAVNNTDDFYVGHGVRANDPQLVLDRGAMLETGVGLDFALSGDGFFAVMRNDGTIEYTRNGKFDISMEGKKGYLVTQDGSHVLDRRGKAIQLTRASGAEQFDLNGLNEKIGVYTFSNPYALQPSSDSCFRTSDTSGQAKALKQEEAKAQILTSTLEQSQVSLADEMVNVIEAQRAFQMNAKMVQTADNIEELINNLR